MERLIANHLATSYNSGMAFAVGSLIYAIYLAFLGAVVGCGVGVICAAILRTTKRAWWKDAALGAAGMNVGFLLCAYVPWPTNTITYKIGDTVVTSTANRFQHPYWIALATTVALPLIRGLVKKHEAGISGQLA